MFVHILCSIIKKSIQSKFIFYCLTFPCFAFLTIHCYSFHVQASYQDYTDEETLYRCYSIIETLYRCYSIIETLYRCYLIIETLYRCYLIIETLSLLFNHELVNCSLIIVRQAKYHKLRVQMLGNFTMYKQLENVEF